MDYDISRILQRPITQRNLERLKYVKFCENQYDLTSEDEHVQRVYSMVFNKTYDELKKIFDSTPKDNFEIHFCVTALGIQDDVKNILTSSLFKKTEQIKMCEFIATCSELTPHKFINYIVTSTSFYERVDYLVDVTYEKDFFKLTGLNSDNWYAKSLSLKVKLHDMKNENLGVGQNEKIQKR